MLTISLSLFNLLSECVYGLQDVPGNRQRKEIKTEKNMYIQEK